MARRFTDDGLPIRQQIAQKMRDLVGLSGIVHWSVAVAENRRRRRKTRKFVSQFFHNSALHGTRHPITNRGGKYTDFRHRRHSRARLRHRDPRRQEPAAPASAWSKSTISMGTPPSLTLPPAASSRPATTSSSAALSSAAASRPKSSSAPPARPSANLASKEPCKIRFSNCTTPTAA